MEKIIRSSMVRLIPGTFIVISIVIKKTYKVLHTLEKQRHVLPNDLPDSLLKGRMTVRLSSILVKARD